MIYKMILKSKILIGDKIPRKDTWSDNYNYFSLIYCFGFLIYVTKINDLSPSEAQEIFGYDTWLKEWIAKQERDKKIRRKLQIECKG